MPASSSTATATQRQISTLYQTYLKTANSFSSYNFKDYFVRQAKTKFSSIPDEASATGSSGASETLRAWLKRTEADLEQLRRCAAVNNMYQAPKLVVEGLVSS